MSDNAFAASVFAGVSLPFMALYYWVFEWAWWLAVPLGLISSYIALCFLVALPFILWAIIGD